MSWDWLGRVTSVRAMSFPSLCFPFRFVHGLIVGFSRALFFHFSHFGFIGIHVTPALSHAAAPFNATPSMPTRACLPGNLYPHPLYRLLLPNSTMCLAVECDS